MEVNTKWHLEQKSPQDGDMKITDELKTYIQKNVKNYKDRLLEGQRVDGPFIVEPSRHLNPDFRNAPKVEDYVHPRVIIWDPIQQHPCFKSGIACPHYNHGQVGSILTPCKWKDGRSEREICHGKCMV